MSARVTAELCGFGDPFGSITSIQVDAKVGVKG